MESLKIRKQSLDTFATPYMKSKPQRQDSNSYSESFSHLSVQSQRMKQKLKEVEERRASPREERRASSQVATPEAGGGDTVVLSAIEPFLGLKIFLRMFKDRTELYKVHFLDAAAKRWFAENRVGLIKEHGITHIDVTELGHTLFDLAA